MLTSVFGISIKYEAWNHQDSLPVYIAGSYDFQTAYIGNRRCIMLAPIEELATLPALKKQIAKIQQIENVPVVFELATVSNYRRKSLIEIIYRLLLISRSFFLSLEQCLQMRKNRQS